MLTSPDAVLTVTPSGAPLSRTCTSPDAVLTVTCPPALLSLSDSQGGTWLLRGE